MPLEPILGSIMLFAGNFAPLGYAFCDGSTLPISSNTALFSLLGTTYGGNGVTTFALPDLRGRVPVHQGSGAGLSPANIGAAGGTETVAVTTAQMPAHAHGVSTSALANTGNPVGGVLARTANPIQLYTEQGPDGAMAPPTTAGGSAAHSNRQPSLGLNYCIAIEGIYPARN